MNDKPMEVSLAADTKCLVIGCPIWHPRERRFYFTDNQLGVIYRYDPATGKNETVYQGWKVGGLSFQADGSLLLFREKGNIVVWRDGRVVKTIVDYLPELAEGMFSDVIADPEGRVFCGTMGTKSDRLYRLDRDGQLTQIIDGMKVSAGLGFSPDLTKLYSSDALNRKIRVFDYHRSTGALTGERMFAETKPEDGYPDGLVVDTQGRIYSARWDGHQVVVYRADGAEESRIKLPVKLVTNVALGGDGLADLYITSAGGEKPEENGALAGGVFCVKGAARGLPEFYSRVGI
jgi:D-xylono/L-arabinono-1,4-lactonase